MGKSDSGKDEAQLKGSTTRSGGAAGKDRDVHPVTGKEGQAERDAAAVRTSGLPPPGASAGSAAAAEQSEFATE